MSRCLYILCCLPLLPLPVLAQDSLALSQRGLLLDDSRLLRDASIERMQQIRFAFREKPGEDDQFKGWSRALGGYGRWDAARGSSRLERREQSALIGADRALSGMWMAGALAGVSRSELHARGGGRSDVDSYHLGVYATTRYYQLGFKFGTLLSWHELAHAHGATAQAFAEAAYPQDFREFTIEPYAGLAYVQQHMAATREGDLAIGADDAFAAYLTLGWRAASSWRLDERRLVGRAGLALRHGFLDERARSRADALELTGRAFDRDVLRADLSLDYELSERLSAGVGYVGQFASDARDNQLQVRFSLAL
ncbi:autotransporter outer membrane beta-barrel domain-containing protein [Pseudomonas sp. LRF_L74]|uniref:autotransporter outer membrane beta-barrel domain-containing protein n=1 Tax=Pseudomonas sp. LRF_L74 TaxID=3369422 RepID=UPI003F641F9B